MKQKIVGRHKRRVTSQRTAGEDEDSPENFIDELVVHP